MWFFTADEHYNHTKILDYCHRPFPNVEVMNEVLIMLHNEHVRQNDVTVHVGDFGWFNKRVEAEQVIRRLNGSHVFIRGSHDRWLSKNHQTTWRKHIDGQFVVCCHYAFRTWERAHYGAWNLHGHSHGTLPGIGKQLDVGVDRHNFKPLSFEEIKSWMDNTPMLHSPDWLRD